MFADPRNQILKDRTFLDELQIPNFVVSNAIAIAEQMEVEAIENIRIFGNEIAEITGLQCRLCVICRQFAKRKPI